jgi:hypothetical protein
VGNSFGLARTLGFDGGDDGLAGRHLIHRHFTSRLAVKAVPGTASRKGALVRETAGVTAERLLYFIGPQQPQGDKFASDANLQRPMRHYPIGNEGSGEQLGQNGNQLLAVTSGWRRD